MKAPTFSREGFIVHAGFRIRKRPLPAGGHAYQVDLGRVSTPDGERRVRAQFQTLDEAKQYAVDNRVERERHGRGKMALTQSQSLDAAQALQELDGTGATLFQAASFYRKHHPVDAEAVETVSALVDRLLREIDRTHRPATVQNLRTRLGRFAQSYGATPARAVTKDNVVDWLRDSGFSPVDRENYRRAVSRLFAYAVQRGQADQNPAHVTKAEREAHGLRAAPRKRPAIFDVPTVRSIMQAAAREVPDLVPFLGVSFFCGLRPHEAELLDWRAVDFRRKTLEVSEEISKTHLARVVKMPASLVEWLTPHRQESGPIAPPYGTLRKMRAKVCEAVGVAWSADVARHTYASAHIALHSDVDGLLISMGHNSLSTLRRHYLNAMSEAEGRAFFAIRPRAGKVIRLSA